MDKRIVSQVCVVVCAFNPQEIEAGTSLKMKTARST